MKSTKHPASKAIQMDAQDIRALIDDLGWTPTRLAAELNVTDDAVRKWLRGNLRPSKAHLILLRLLRYNLDVHGVRGLNLPEEVAPHATRS